jgi:hypothetical protein
MPGGRKTVSFSMSHHKKLDEAVAKAIAYVKGVASWEWAARFTMDIPRFKKEHEALHEEYKRDSGTRRFCLDTVDLTKATNSATA